MRPEQHMGSVQDCGPCPLRGAPGQTRAAGLAPLWLRGPSTLCQCLLWAVPPATSLTGCRWTWFKCPRASTWHLNSHSKWHTPRAAPSWQADRGAGSVTGPWVRMGPPFRPAGLGRAGQGRSDGGAMAGSAQGQQGTPCPGPASPVSGVHGLRWGGHVAAARPAPGGERNTSRVNT